MDLIFATGYFTIEDDGTGLMSQRLHEDFEWDDPVIDQKCDYEYDGYVSNVGKEVTIYIKKELMSEENIETVKHHFIFKPEEVKIACVSID